MNLELEKKVLAKLLMKPDEVKREKVKVNWFQHEEHRQLAYTLMNTDEPFADFSEIELKVKEYYPKSSVTEDWLHDLKFEEMLVDDLKASVKSLEENYIRSRTHDASLDYAEYPNNKNRKKLEDWLRKLDELEVEEDEGELQEPLDQILYELENEVENGLRSFYKLDRVLGSGLEKGMLFVLAGRPGTGKTAFAVSMVLEILRKQNATIDFFSLEMAKVEMLKRFVANITGINSYKFKNAKLALKEEEKEQVVKAAGWLYDTDLRMHDNKFSLSDIERTIRQRKHAAKGDYLAVIDYIGLMDAEEDLQRNQAVGKISRRIKRLTNELGIPIILLSQLNRQVEYRENKVPTLADLRDSGDVEQDANVVAFLSENDEVDHTIDLTIAKNRSGQLATLHYEFYKPATSFREVDLYES